MRKVMKQQPIAKEDEGLVLVGGRPRTVEKPRKLKCDKCVITQINDTTFAAKNQYVTFSVKENAAELVLKAIPSIKDCPCEWSKFAIEYAVILTGKKDIKRKNIFSSLNETLTFDASKNPAHFIFKGCSVTIKISKINQDLRNGNVRRGRRNFRQVMVPLRLAGKVRCGKSWRRFQVEFTDA